MENFVVSARKYRPATFESVVGQQHITSTLKNAIGRNQLAHAYLFCGPRGVGKTTCARIFAKAINCQSGADGEACGECESCRSFNEGRSFNIHELDAASNNSVDDIRSLTEQVRIPPQLGRYSVYIIDEVHMLSAAAFNAFLKTLEEPPAHAVFILATTEKHKILPTILSRCQIYDFNRIRVEDGVQYLKYIADKEGVTFDDESLHLIARKADGGMRDALSMFDKAVSFCGPQLNFREVAGTLNVLDYDSYFRITDQILAGDYPSVLTSFDEILSKGFSAQLFIAGLNSHFRDLLMCKNERTAGLLEVTGNLLERYRKQSATCDTGFLFESIALMTAADGTLRTASNQRLNAELALMKLCAASQKKNGLSELTTGHVSIVNTASALPEKQVETNKVTAERSAEAAVSVAAEDGHKNGNTSPYEQRTGAAAPVNTDVPPVIGHDPKVLPTGTTTGMDEPQEEKSEVESGLAITPNEEVMPAPAVQPTSEPTSERPTPVAPPAIHKQEPVARVNGNGRPTISGTSITDLLGKSKNVYETAGDEEGDEDIISSVDPDSESKIQGAAAEFIRRLDSERPRIAVAFHAMQAIANRVKVTVPTDALREEILRNRTEILTLLSDVASIDGILELDVIVKEDTQAKRPVKVEDRLKYLTEQNPTLTLLRQKLDLDIE